jgi:hydroxymethylbilane synthase
MRKILRLGTRASPLALKQAQEIKKIFPALSFEIIPILTLGDKDKTTPLDKVEADDFFTREIDAALLKGQIDIAVHSSKDLAATLTQGLALVVETESISPYDALISRNNLKLKALAQGSRIGLSSQRRKERLARLRPDLIMVDIRGNIGERLGLIDKGKIDALIVAQAALIRLGLEDKIAEIFPLNVFNTHPKQGSLSLVARSEECEKVKFILSAPAPAIGN